MRLTKIQNYWKYSKKQCEYETMFVSISYKTIKGTLLGQKQFLANENPLKMTKNALYFILKSLFAHKIFLFLGWPFGHV